MTNKRTSSDNGVLVFLLAFLIYGVGVGCTAINQFSENNPPPVVTASTVIINPALIDTDADGISDDLDNCLSTSANARVDIHGCALDTDGDTVADYQDVCGGTPLGVKVGLRGCGIDVDSDGVPNYRDSCLNTPADVSVDGYGCEVDSDNDGIADSKDLCVGTSPGLKVESMGCHVTETVLLKNIHFEPGSHLLKESAQYILKELATALERYPNYRVEVAAHADNNNSTVVDRQLSVNSAVSARDFLLTVGVSSSSLSVTSLTDDISSEAGKSESDSLHHSLQDSLQNSLQNKRVEMRVVEVD
jgi:outer membrane protein OmpA-like peptidoglycan-associated protein